MTTSKTTLSSKRRKKLLIGVLYCGEPDYEQCLEALSQQTFTDFKAFRIEWKSKLAAHSELFGTFMKSADHFDFFLKLDADMVIDSVTFLQRLVDEFENNPQVIKLTTPVHDYFTDGMIFGMHAWRSCHKWPQRESELFTDDDAVIPASRKSSLAGDHEGQPDVLHCAYSSKFYAFHYGLHRGVKARALLKCPYARRGNLINNFSMWKNMCSAACTHKDQNRILARYGYLAGIAGQANAKNISYTSTHAKDLFNQIEFDLDKSPFRTKLKLFSNASGALFLSRLLATTFRLVHRLKRLIGTKN